MGAYYKLKRNDDEEYGFRYHICFSGFYSTLTSLEYVKLYIPKNEKFVASKEDVELYCKLLNSMGFKIELTSTDNFKFTLEGRDYDTQYEFTIKIADNSLVVNKILLNAVRYLYERGFPPIVSKFIQLAKNLKQPHDIWNCFLVCHYAGDLDMNHNHWILPWYQYVKINTKEEFEKDILNSDVNKDINKIVKSVKYNFKGGKQSTNVRRATTFSGAIKIHSALVKENEEQ